jgi:hypothetical protein
MNNVYKAIYQEALNYIINKAGLEYVIDQLKNDTNNYAFEIKAINDLFRMLLNAAIYTKRMNEAIGPVENLDDFLWGFDPIKLYSQYGEKWELMAGKIRELKAVGNLKEVNISDDHWAYWEMFCKTALSAACFLSQLKTVQTFKAFVRGFEYNEMTAAVLPLLLQKEIYALTFQSACYFLSRAEFCDYIAPEPRVKALLFDIEIIETRENYELLKTLIAIGRVNDEKTDAVNKLFLMIASGGLPGQESKNNDFRNGFIDHITPILTSKT